MFPTLQFTLQTEDEQLHEAKKPSPFCKMKYDIKTQNIFLLQSLTNLFNPSHQPLEGLRVLLHPSGWHEALHLKLLRDDGQVRVWP